MRDSSVFSGLTLIPVWNTFSVLQCSFSLCSTFSPGGEHREAYCLHKYFKWKGRDRVPPGHSPSRAQSGRRTALISHSGRRRRLYDGTWCQWLWIWCWSQCWSRASPGKQTFVLNLRKTAILHVLGAFCFTNLFVVISPSSCHTITVRCTSSPAACLQNVYTFDVLLHRVRVKIASLCFLRLCVYQWRSSDRGRRKRPAELLLLLQRRQACPHPL